MKDETATRARARQQWQEVNTFPALEPEDAYTEMTLDHVFGEVWSRPGLARKDRRWITLTTIAAHGGAPMALEIHVRSAIRSGDISPDEMIEFAVHFAHYGGWPLSSTLYSTIRKVLAED